MAGRSRSERLRCTLGLALGSALVVISLDAAGQGLPPMARAPDPPPAPAPTENALPASAEPASVTGPAAPATEVRDLGLTPDLERPWQITADVQYRTLLVTDGDPANDRRVIYRLQPGYEVLPALIAFVRFGLDQQFVRVDDEAGTRFEDTALGAYYVHSVDLSRLGWERSLGLFHRLRFYLPTSFQSQQQDLYTAAEWTTRARVQLTGAFYAGLVGVLQYRWHEYAEQAGPGGGTLPRFIVEGLAFAEWSPLVSERYGNLTAGLALVADETVHHSGRDPGSLAPGDLPPGTLAAGDDVVQSRGAETFVSPHYGYQLYLTYAPPVPANLTLTASLEQAGSVLSNGEPRLYFVHRDQTEVVLRATATF
jgi:hypothetical protein